MTTHESSPLADVDPAGAEALEAGHLGRLVERAEVEVQPVLGRLRLGDQQEEQVRRDAVLGAARGRFQHHLVVVSCGPSPAQRLLPEGREGAGLGGVDADALPAQAGGGRRASVVGSVMGVTLAVGAGVDVLVNDR